jgi:hypothetical protein
MRRLLLTACLFLWMSLPAAASAQQADSTPTPNSAETGQTPAPEPESETVAISSPTVGETVRGVVPISGLLTLPGFSSWELAFAPLGNPTDTWFLLKSGSELTSGELYLWDTSLLTDGDYSLRLRAAFSDAYREVLVSPIRVRNYSADTVTPSPTISPTNTAGATATATIQVATSTPSPTPRFTPTPLPPNPAILRNDDIFLALLQGGGYVGLAFLLFGAIAFLKEKLSKK